MEDLAFLSKFIVIDGSVLFCCPDVDVINVFKLEVEPV